MRLNTGEFQHVYDPSVDAGVPTYVNDHSIVRGHDGQWHLFGITHAEPANPAEEKTFLHATAAELHGPWHTREPALVVDPHYHGERHLWAPHVIPAYGRYWMFYAAGGTDHARQAINLATSEDLFGWTRSPEGPLFRDGVGARDPMVLWTGECWTVYYCATTEPDGGHHAVVYRCSQDLLDWGERHVAFTSERTPRDSHSPTESPFVVHRQGRWYLFIGPCGGYADTPDGYVCTAVYESDSPWEFRRDGLVTRMCSHAAEVVDERWVTSAGWGQGGLHLAELRWQQG